MTNSLEEYAKLFERLGLTELSVEEENFKLKLKKQVSAAWAEKNKALIQDTISRVEEPSTVTVSGTAVKAPLLGIFYGEVNGKAFSVGDSVRQGDVLCSIEAMKMLNEVKAPLDGVITSIGAREGDLVEYDQILFEIA